MNKIILDLDDTICSTIDGDYENSIPREDVINKIREYKELGFKIAINTSRNMRTHQGNIGLINAKTLPIIIAWLTKNSIPYDELYIGKPWCGEKGFYVDDRAIRPDEFANLSTTEISTLIGVKVDNN
jgi:capsule biosynthesis phosphatase